MSERGFWTMRQRAVERCLLVGVVALLLVVLVAAPAFALDPPTYLFGWGSAGSGNSEFSNPEGIAVAPDGSVYVTDYYNSRIQVFDSSGNFVKSFSSRAVLPLGITFRPDGHMWITCSSSVNEWDVSGAQPTWLNTWTTGDDGTRLGYTPDLAFDSQGNFYVTDGTHNCVWKFDAAGNAVGHAGGPGSGPGQFQQAEGIVVDSSDILYVADPYNHRIQKFDTSLNVLPGGWGTHGTGPGEFDVPDELAIDSSDRIYVSDAGNARVQVFDTSGTYLTEFGGRGTGPGQFGGPEAIDIAPSGAIYVTDDVAQNVQCFTPPTETGAPPYLGSWGFAGGSGAIVPEGLDVDPSSGLVYLADQPFRRIDVYSATGTLLRQFSTAAVLGGKVIDCIPLAADFDGDGDLWVVGYLPDNTGAPNYRGRIFEFDMTDPASPSLIRRWDYGDGGSQMGRLVDLAFDSRGNFYVSDIDNNCIRKFDSDGDPVTHFGGPLGSGDGQFRQPEGLAIDSSDTMFVVDCYNHRIQKLDTSGNFLGKWGTSGTGNGQFNVPDELTLDAQGNVYVTDVGNHRVQQFDSNGTFISKWGRAGSGPGLFSTPEGIAVGPQGNIYVTDNYAVVNGPWAWHAVQYFGSSAQPNAKKGGIVPSALTAPPVSLLSVAPPDGSNGWYKTNPEITLTSNLPGDTYYQWAEHAINWSSVAGTIRPAYSSWGVIYGEGTRTLNYYSMATAGSQGTQQSQTFKVDITAPSVPAASGAVLGEDTVRVSWSPAADAISGIAGYELWDADTNTLACPMTDAFTSATTVSGLAEATTHRYYVQAVDLAGNRSPASATLVLTTASSTPGDSTGSIVTGDDVPASAGSVDFVFDHVTTSGGVLVHPSTSQSAPSGFQLISGTYYDISTTVTFSGQVHLTIHYDPNNLNGVAESDLELWHWKNGGWVNITTGLDPGNDIITGDTDSFSPFAVFAPTGTGGGPTTSTPAASWWSLSLLLVAGLAATLSMMMRSRTAAPKGD